MEEVCDFLKKCGTFYKKGYEVGLKLQEMFEE